MPSVMSARTSIPRAVSFAGCERVAGWYPSGMPCAPLLLQPAARNGRGRPRIEPLELGKRLPENWFLVTDKQRTRRFGGTPEYRPAREAPCQSLRSSSANGSAASETRRADRVAPTLPCLASGAQWRSGKGSRRSSRSGADRSPARKTFDTDGGGRPAPPLSPGVRHPKGNERVASRSGQPDQADRHPDDRGGIQPGSRRVVRHCHGPSL